MSPWKHPDCLCLELSGWALKMCLRSCLCWPCPLAAATQGWALRTGHYRCPDVVLMPHPDVHQNQETPTPWRPDRVPTPSLSSAPAVGVTPPSQQPRLEQPRGTTSLMDTQDPHRGILSHYPAASLGEEAPTTLPAPAPAPLFCSEAVPTHDPVNFWKEIK